MRFYDYITEFIFVEDKPEQADIIFVPGGPYPDSARYAARLYQQGFAPYIMPSGKYSILKGQLELPEELWTELALRNAEAQRDESESKIQAGNREKQFSSIEDLNEISSVPERISVLQRCIRTESDYLCEVMRQAGVPDSALIGEDQAAYTYENAIYSRKKLETLGIRIGKAILCCQAFHARRCLLYYKEQFPEVEFLVCPVVTRGISRDNWYQNEQGIDTVLGEVERCGGQFHEIMRQHMNAEG